MTTIASRELLCRLMHGAVSVTQIEDGFQCYRFTEPQRLSYLNNPDFHAKTFATAGIVLDCWTDAKTISMVYKVKKGSSRMFYYFDVVINGVLTAHPGAESYREKPFNSFTIGLNGEYNHVQIYYPCLAQAIIQQLVFYGETKIVPVKRDKVMLSFGDSITQGYDAKFPSLAYPSQLAEKLQADCYNKAIGGDIFNPALLSEHEGVTPDYVTVGYGTNDWSHGRKEDFQANVQGFFTRLEELYPKARILVILPLWRKDWARVTNVGTFEEARRFIAKTASRNPNSQILDGMKLIPHVTDVFSDGYLHPNDFGFHYMGRSIIEQMN